MHYHLVLTQKCNLNCRYCGSTVEPSIMPVDLAYPLQELKDFLKEDKDKSYSEFLWKSKTMQQVFNTINKVASKEANVLILGENGTGKEILAYKIHKLSKRSEEVFVRIDLGALSENLFESEMFGHMKGSFTDAKDNRTGKMESASDGTLLLDEIGNMSFPMQSKLLTALQSKKIVPVGSNKEKSVNFRLICATNKNIDELVTKKLFREDLLYRINTIVIEIPPLRKRIEDIEYLAIHFLNIFKEKYRKTHLEINELAINKLKSYNWPGNVRELKHSIEKAVILCDSDILTEESFQLRVDEFIPDMNSGPKSFEEAEKFIILNTLKSNLGNISETARELKIGRQTLYRKIEKYNLKY